MVAHGVGGRLGYPPGPVGHPDLDDGPRSDEITARCPPGSREYNQGGDPFLGRRRTGSMRDEAARSCL